MSQKAVHILAHFEQEICGTCDQNLIRIGENFYVLHGTITCIPKNIKTEMPLDLKDEAETVEDDDFDQHFVLTHDDDLDTVDVELKEETPSVNDERSDQYIAFENRCEKDSTMFEKQNVKPVKSTRLIGDKTTHLECNECNKTYTRIDHLKRHVIEVHRPSERNFMCNACGTKFSFQFRLNSHKKSSTICNICGKIFCMKKQLLEHQDDEHDMIKNDNNEKSTKSSKCKIDGCNEMVAAHGWIVHMADKHTASKQEKNDNRYACDICSKTYKTKRGIEFHILSIHCPSSKKFKCEICGYATVSQKELKRHQMKIHFKQRNFMCSECGKIFLLKSQLILHSYQHSGEKPFSCSFQACSKRFRVQSQIYEHMRMHTKEKPYCCTIENCDRRFSYKIDLKRHKFSAHGIYTNEYHCEICAEKFPENMLLKKHMKNHGNNI